MDTGRYIRISSAGGGASGGGDVALGFASVMLHLEK